MTTLGRVLSRAYKAVPGSTGPSGTITFKQQNADPGITVAGCRKRPIKAYEKAIGSAYLNASDTVWFLPSVNLVQSGQQFKPQPGDAIYQGGVFWIIEHAESEIQESEWKVYGVQSR